MPQRSRPAKRGTRERRRERAWYVAVDVGGCIVGGIIHDLADARRYARYPGDTVCKLVPVPLRPAAKKRPGAKGKT